MAVSQHAWDELKKSIGRILLRLQQPPKPIMRQALLTGNSLESAHALYPGLVISTDLMLRIGDTPGTISGLLKPGVLSTQPLELT